MEIFDAVLVSILVGVVGSLLPRILAVIVYLFTTKLVVVGSTQISTLDKLIAETGICSARVSGLCLKPAAGVHFLYLSRPIIAVKDIAHTERGGDRTAYSLYVLGSGGIPKIQDRLLGDPNNIAVRYVYAPMPWKISCVTTRLALPGKPYPWQTRVVDRVIAEYGRTSSVSVLLCGRPGAGKSTIGEFISAALHKKFGVAPEVVKGMDLTTRGLLLEDAFGIPTQTTPIVLLLDEFDTTIAFAERDQSGKDGKGEAKSLADSPSSLLSLLDRMNRIQHLIVVASTNRASHEMTAGIYARYTRRGRIDIHVSA